MKFHEKSKQNFNEKFDYFFDNLIKIPYTKLSITNNKFTPRINTTTINSTDILDIPVEINSLTDGSEIGRSFIYNNKIIRLNNQFYEEFLKICSKINTSREFRIFLSIDFIKVTSFSWIQKKYITKIDLDFTTFFEEQVASKVKDYKIWFPISNFFIEENFSIGDVDFQEVTEELIETWFKNIDINNENIKLAYEKEKKELKGYAMGVVKVKAEPKVAKDISTEKLDVVLSILRIFEGVIFQPNKKSYCLPKGLENKEVSISYITNHQNCIISKEESLLSSHSSPFILDRVSLNQIINFEGFKLIDKILKSDSLTPFQETCLNSFIIYSQSSLKRNISDKIIYILVSLESLLLKTQGEPIQQNVGERFAFYSEKESNERKELVKLFREIYDIRSKFIHHGKEIENMDAISLFMKNVFNFFLHLMLDLENFKTKEDFIKHIDEIKFS